MKIRVHVHVLRKLSEALNLGFLPQLLEFVMENYGYRLVSF